MYGVPDALSSLEQQQLVHAVVTADKLAAPHAVQQTQQALAAAAQSEQGLSAAALDLLASLPALPACLLQLLPTVLNHTRCCQPDGAANMATVSSADTASGSRVQRLLVAALLHQSLRTWRQCGQAESCNGCC
jgi:hypothetical protein